jgi:hypothetical protein
MKNTPEQLALQHSLALCQGHAAAQLIAVLTQFQSKIKS